MAVRHNRGLGTALILLALAGAAVILPGWALQNRLPNPTTAGQEDLLRWLLRDLDQEPFPVQLALIDRLEREIRAGIKLPLDMSRLNETQQHRLRRNTQLLKHRWFLTRVDGYYSTPPSQRIARLDEQIATIDNWTALDTELSGRLNTHHAVEGPSCPPDHLFDQISRWIDQSTGAQRQRMVQVIRLGVVRWLATRDLDGQSDDTRRRLANHIARGLNEQPPPGEALLHLTESEQERLRANSRLLMEAWFGERAEEYFALPKPERAAFLDGRIEDIRRWGILQLLAPDTGDTDPRNRELAATTELIQMTQTWIRRARPDQRQRLQKMIAATQQRMLLRRLSGPPPSPR